MSTDRITFTLNHLVGQLNKQADRILRIEFGVTYSQFLFLLHLTSAGTTSSSLLAQQLGVSRAAVSKRIGWFESRGLISVGHSAHDHRLVTLTITGEGRRLVGEMSDVLEQRFRQSFSGLEGVNLDQLHHTLQIVLEHLRDTPRMVTSA